MAAINELVVLITGSTDGIGRITARMLAEAGATVIIHGRSRDTCDAAADEIRQRTGSRKLTSYVADLASLSAVRALGQEIAADHPRLDVLINNAGIGPGKPSDSKRSLSPDGHELRFAVNYLAPFLLTRLLLPILGRGRPARIVNVSSAAQQAIDFNDVMLEHSYDPWRAYAQSKLALAMFTFELAERSADDNLTVNCLHPGSLLDTKMVRKSAAAPQGSPESGAEVEVYVATDPGLQGMTGLYFEEKRKALAHEQAYDIEARQRLWRLSESIAEIG